MKKWLALLLCLALAAVSAGCGGAGMSAGGGKTTLMIYMIGSDLEAKNGAATDDLMEIQESGVDTRANSVVIMTGGSPQWQNELVSADDNMILTLNGDSYETESAAGQASMGEAETLSSFLRYCVEKHPAEHYALILWNHGNGPLIGYGKDMLFDDDALTLREMDEAMKSSPFAAEQRLDWVGFDACLMASAELSCVWAPYADYLVASQEVEPAFGWQYGFLKNLGKTASAALLGDITESYLSTCLDYFEKKNYQDRDTTLACVDLSFAGELSDAVNDLFTAASARLGKEYDELTARRVSTRALGRASTGSEYDLVDLNDFSQQLAADFPAESEALCGVIEKMVVTNATNAEGLSGMSLYCPFYNKGYYEKEWSAEYRGMNLFPAYLDFLAEYEKTWLGKDMQEDFASSDTPSAESESRYTLRLTADQAQHYASAKYYILQKEGEETYTKVYSSGDVSYRDGRLTADFNGNVIYFHNGADRYVLPVTTEHDTVGAVTNYSCQVRLDNATGGSFLTAGLRDEGDQLRFKNCRYLIAADKQKGEIAVSALMPFDTEQSGSDLLGGKLEEVDVSDYTTFSFEQELRRTIKRSDKGVVQAVDEWVPTDSHIWSECPIADGAEFVYAPLGYGEYALIFEICDTQGSLYCSEPIDLDTSDVDWLPASEPETTVVESDGTFPLLLREDDDFALYLDKAKNYRHEYLTLLAENKSSKKLQYAAGDIVCNDTVCCSSATGFYFDIDAGKKEYPYVDLKLDSDLVSKDDLGPSGFDFGDAESIGAVRQLSSLKFSFSLNGYDDRKTLWQKAPIEIRFKKGKEYRLDYGDSQWDQPLLDRELTDFNGASAKPQTVHEADGVKIELLTFGMDGNYLKGAFRVANTADSGTCFITSDGFAADGIFFHKSLNLLKIPAGFEEYFDFSIDKDDLEESGVTGMQQLSFVFRSAADDYKLWQGYGETVWADVKLDKKSSAASVFPSGSETLMEENDVVLKLKDYENSGSGSEKWLLTLENRSDEGVRVEMTDLTVNGKKIADEDDWKPVYLFDTQAGAGQSTLAELSVAMLKKTDQEDVREVAFTPVVYDFTGERILFIGETTVTVRVK